jgi:undecaprenyl-diphosphatase
MIRRFARATSAQAQPEPRPLDLILLAKAAIMGIVEGLTEFLPVSSTGHLILAGQLIDFTGGSLTPEKIKAFEISIQTGAILAIVLLYWQRLSSTVMSAGSNLVSRRFLLNVFVGFLPAVVLGLTFGKKVQAALFNPIVVASTFILGGLIILWAENRKGAVVRVAEVEDMSLMDALKVGLVQCLAFIPGTSRSGSTIIGGMLFGLSRKAATEFTFFLAIPTLFGAGAYSLLKVRHSLVAADLPLFGVGFLFSFIAAWLCVRWLLRYVSTHNFIAFAWYRIAFGGVILLTAYFKLINWVD